MSPGRATPWLALAAVILALTGGAVALERTALEEAPNEAPVPRAAPSSPASTETLEEQVLRVARAVAEIRGHPFQRIPEPTYLAPAELAARAGDLLADYEAEDQELAERILEVLGAVPPGTDLRALLTTALGEQVSGFYDPETGELVVGTTSQEERLGPLDEITLAHELQHALADQIHGLPVDERFGDGEEDAAYAALSLVEGDATLTMITYAQEELSSADRLRLFAEQSELAGQLDDLTELPHFLQRSLEFPYVEGLAFVQALHARGGFVAVDDAYAHLPGSTLEILVPERYLSGAAAPADPTDPDDLDAPWQRRPSLGLGAADLLFLFEAPGGDTDGALPGAREAATAWRGGEVTLWTDGERSALSLALVGEPPLCGAVGDWYARAFGSGSGDQDETRYDGPDQDAVLRCGDGQVRLGIAPDLATAERLAD